MRIREPWGRRSMAAALSVAAQLSVGLAEAAPSAHATHLDRKPEDEVIYFVLPDRFAVAQAQVDATSRAWRTVHGSCAATATAPGSYRVEIGPLDYMICVSEGGQ